MEWLTEPDKPKRKNLMTIKEFRETYKKVNIISMMERARDQFIIGSEYLIFDCMTEIKRRDDRIAKLERKQGIIKCDECKFFSELTSGKYCRITGMEVEPNDFCSYARGKD